MTRIGVRELRQNASQYIALVKRGDVIEVTERGELVALLVAPGPVMNTREKLIAAGQLLPAQSTLQLPIKRVRAKGSQSITEILRDLGEERLS